jgi:hypothetical protein
VRVINANALDLALFQFDYDLSFSALFSTATARLWPLRLVASPARFAKHHHHRLPACAEGALRHRSYPTNQLALAVNKAA